MKKFSANIPLIFNATFFSYPICMLIALAFGYRFSIYNETFIFAAYSVLFFAAVIYMLIKKPEINRLNLVLTRLMPLLAIVIAVFFVIRVGEPDILLIITTWAGILVCISAVILFVGYIKKKAYKIILGVLVFLFSAY